MKRLRILVNDSALRDELVSTHKGREFTLEVLPADEGFGESLYPLLVDAGVVALPASVVGGVIASWIHTAWQRRGEDTTTVIGLETDEQHEAISLSEDDVEKIALRLAQLLNDASENKDDTA